MCMSHTLESCSTAKASGLAISNSALGKQELRGTAIISTPPSMSYYVTKQLLEIQTLLGWALIHISQDKPNLSIHLLILVWSCTVSQL